MGQKLSPEEKGQLVDQLMELLRVAVNGIRPFADVRRGLQDIIEGRSPATLNWNPPAWWRTPEQQLERARQLWPNAVLPEPPKEFTPRTSSEVLLLHVPDTFDSLWNKVDAPTGYTKYREESIKADKRNLRLSPNKREYTEPVWLAFNPEHGKNACPDSLWGQSDLAASEVLSALIQFPEWPLAWFNGASAPNLSGYQLKYYRSWSYAPYFYRWDSYRRLKLSSDRALFLSKGYASPSVREC